MPKARLRCELLVPSQADGLTVQSALTTDLLGKVLFSADRPLTVEQNEAKNWTVACDLRFNVAAECDDVFDKIQTRWSSGALKAKILAASRVSRHLCPHELPPEQWYTCRDASFTEVVK